jgi:P27 family predicted phage terminase small subunit
MPNRPGQGRKPQPTALKLLKGNPGRRPLNQDEPRPQVRLPRVPDHLSDEAKREWRRLGRMLVGMGVMTEADGDALALLCTAWARWLEAEGQLRRFGIVIKSPSGYPIQSPYLSIARQSMAELRSLLAEFGLTPASRSRVRVAEPAEADPFEAFLRRRPGG